MPALSQVEVGSSHSCGLDLQGGAICWGDNDFGQLNAPMDVSFTTIAAGSNHTCGITTESQTVCWGLADGNGLLDVPTDAEPFVQLQAGGSNSCGLENTGGVRCWGVFNRSFESTNNENGFVKIATTFTNLDICGLTADGAIECSRSGYDFEDEYIDVAGTTRDICALSVNGDVECLRGNDGLVNGVPIGGILPLSIREEINQANNEADFAAIFGNGGLCALTVGGATRCFSQLGGASSLPSPSEGPQLPLAPSDLRVSIYSDSTVEIFWTSAGNLGDGGFASAEIFRDGELLASTQQFSSFIDNSLEPGVTYQYEVRLTNSFGLSGPLSKTVSVDTNSRSAVDVPGGYILPERPANPSSLQALVYSDTLLELIWDRPSVNVFGYEIYRDHELLTFTNGTSFLDNTIAAGAKHHYDIIAVNADGQILGFDGIAVGGHE